MSDHLSPYRQALIAMAERDHEPRTERDAEHQDTRRLAVIGPRQAALRDAIAALVNGTLIAQAIAEACSTASRKE